MIRHIPRNSRIFIGLVIITLLLTYVSVTLSDYAIKAIQRRSIIDIPHKSAYENQTDKPIHILPTDDWSRYEDHAFPLAFLYPKDWTVKSSTDKTKNYVVTLTPPKSKTTIDIFINKDSVIGFDDLNTKPYTVDGAQGLIVGDNLIGVKAGEYYYTFDGSFSPKQADEFATIMSTVQFK